LVSKYIENESFTNLIFIFNSNVCFDSKCSKPGNLPVSLTQATDYYKNTLEEMVVV
jgi:hypothetical protein